MKSLIYISLIFTVVIAAVTAALPGGAAAQDVIAEKARHALERTEEIIETARRVVDDSHSQKGRVKLHRAMAIQKRARLALTNNRAYRNSIKLTLMAREEAREAMAIGREEARIAARLFRIIEETGERISNAEGLLLESNLDNFMIRKMLQEANNLLEKARLNAHQYRYQLAMKLAENARKHALKAQQQARKARSVKEITGQRIVMIKQLLNRAGQRVDGNDQVSTAKLERAEDQLNKAEQLIQKGRYIAARSVVEQCEKITRSLIRNLRNNVPPDPGFLRGEITRIRSQLDKLTSQNAGKDPEAAAVMERAGGMLEMAEGHIAGGRMEQARRTINRARDILQRIRAELEHKPDQTTAESLIGEAEEKLAMTSDMMETCSAPEIDKMIERARSHLDAARASLDQGRIERVLSEARLTINILERIREVCASK